MKKILKIISRSNVLIDRVLMNVKFINLAAARNLDKENFDALFKKCFVEACSQFSKSELISALCEKSPHEFKLKKAA